MRIISGTHKGRKLLQPIKIPVRPTTDKSKEALFSILENRYCLNNKSVLDLFSGTGNIAYEFASRGCSNIIAVDHNQNCINYIKNNIDHFNLKINITKYDSLRYIETCNKKFDFIFADPPYNYNKHQKLTTLIFANNLIKKNGCLIIEHDKNMILEGSNIEIRKYGTVYFSIFTL